MEQRLYSIVIPTFNEEKDILATLEFLSGLEWENLEVVIVDESIDSTAKIIEDYQWEKIRLLKPNRRLGRTGSRNLGIVESNGAVVIVLNADVHLPPDFISRLDLHYSAGADAVLVKSRVSNVENLYARYIDCAAEYTHYHSQSVEIDWTEGYSCRKAIAMEAGLFPSGYPLDICAGEDGIFGRRVRAISKTVIRDDSIVCSHVSPSTFVEYWRVRKGRGAGGPPLNYFIRRRTLLGISTIATIRAICRFSSIFLIIPQLLAIRPLLGLSQFKSRDGFGFFFAKSIEDIAFCCGELQSAYKLFELRIRGGEDA